MVVVVQIVGGVGGFFGVGNIGGIGGVAGLKVVVGILLVEFVVKGGGVRRVVVLCVGGIPRVEVLVVDGMRVVVVVLSVESVGSVGVVKRLEREVVEDGGSVGNVSTTSSVVWLSAELGSIVGSGTVLGCGFDDVGGEGEVNKVEDVNDSAAVSEDGVNFVVITVCPGVDNVGEVFEGVPADCDGNDG